MAEAFGTANDFTDGKRGRAGTAATRGRHHRRKADQRL
jgi:hypothetical protein